MELTQLTAQIYEVAQRLQKSTGEIYKLAQTKAHTERDYRMELSKEILRLRAEGIPATLIGDMARGNVAELKFKRDIADGQYKSSIEALEALKSSLTAYQTICKYQEDI